MTSLYLGHCVVVLMPIGSPTCAGIKLVLQPEPSTIKLWIPAGFVLSNEEPVDATVRELVEKISLLLIAFDSTSVRDRYVCVPLPDNKFS
jgi:ADP-ribose pyrophosphatase YjhB (NUDIX family)